MSHSRSARAALSRTLAVLAIFSGALIGMAGTSLATSTSEVGSNSSETTVSFGPEIAGVSLGTFTWALIGFTVLVLGFIAASRAGRSTTIARLDRRALGVIGSPQSSTHDAHGEPTAVVAA